MSNREQTELDRYKTAERIANEHLQKFDTLDFDVYSNQRWDLLKGATAPTSWCIIQTAIRPAGFRRTLRN